MLCGERLSKPLPGFTAAEGEGGGHVRDGAAEENDTPLRRHSSSGRKGQSVRNRFELSAQLSGGRVELGTEVRIAEAAQPRRHVELLNGSGLLQRHGHELCGDAVRGAQVGKIDARRREALLRPAVGFSFSDIKGNRVTPAAGPEQRIKSTNNPGVGRLDETTE